MKIDTQKADEMEELLELAQQSGDAALELQVLEAMDRYYNEIEQGAAQESGGYANVAKEFGSGLVRGAAATADMAQMMTPAGQLNAARRFFGDESAPPAVSDIVNPLVPGGQMGEGLDARIVRGVGEIIPAALGGGGVMRGIAKGIDSTATSLGSRFMRSMGATTPAQDVGYGAVSAIGSEVGEEVGGTPGAIVGAIAAPITVAGGGVALKSTLNAGKKGIDALMGVTKNVSDEGAATMLAEAMVREGLTPDDVAAKLSSMGDEGMLADAGNNFARLLRVASNKIPRIEGLAAQKLNKRQAGQSARLSGALDDGTGTPLLTVDDEIARLENTMGPEITKLYDSAKNSGFEPSKRLKALLSGDNSVGRAATKARENLADYEAAGIEITPMSLVDETKKVIDAQIAKAVRDGDKGTTSRLLNLKKIMVQEADSAAPDYAKARSMFAGKEQLKNAADLGGDFFKINSRELKQLTETFGESEKRMYKLGAKQAIMDRFDNINANADLVGRTFGKNGDVEKLRTLFDDPTQFNQFRSVLEKEANWVLTRRTAQSNSTTAKQISDEDMAQQAFAAAREAFSSPMGAANAIGRIMGGLSKKRGDVEFTQALEKAGDILLESGMNPDGVRLLLKKADAKLIQRALENQVKRRGSMATGSGAALQNIQSQDSQQATGQR